jgi:hypothetical protein
MRAYEREIQIPDDISNYKNAMRFLSAIPALRKDIMEGDSKYPVALGLREIFKGIGSPEGIEKERLAALLERRIFLLLNEGRDEPFSPDSKEDISDFIKCCFDNLAISVGSQLVQCSEFTRRIIYPNNRSWRPEDRPQIILDLSIKRGTEEEESSNEFVEFAMIKLPIHPRFF